MRSSSFLVSPGGDSHSSEFANVIEQLEDRSLLTYSVDLTAGGVLTINQATAGDASNLTVSTNGATYTFADAALTFDAATGAAAAQVTNNGTSVTVSEADVTSIIITLGDGNDAVTVLSINDVLNLNGGTGTDTLTGSAGGNNFVVTGTNAGTVAYGATLTFSNIDSIAGGGGTDTVTGTGAGDTISINGANAVTTASIAFTAISTVNGAGGNDTVTATAGADNFTVTGTNAFSTSSIGFTSIESVAGNGGTDTVTGTAGSESFTVNGANAVTVASIAFTAIATVNGAGGSDTLVGTAAGDTFSVTGADSGSVAGLGFASFENLDGGAGADSFNIATASSISGTINGGDGDDTLVMNGTGTVGSFDGGNNTDTIDESALAMVVANLTTAISGSITNVTTYSSVEALIGNDTNSMLNLPAAGTTNVTITGQHDGTVMNGGTMNFTNFTNVVGNGGDDNITVMAGGSLLNNVLDTGAGNDTITIHAGAGVATVNGGTGNDTLIVDFTGNAQLALIGGMRTIMFNGGENAGDNDEVVLTGYDFTTNPDFADGDADVTVNHTGAESGNVVVGPAGGVLGMVQFAETEPLILAGTVADMVINLPGGDVDVLLADDTAANFGANGNDVVGRSAIDATGFEYTEFVNPTNTLTINLGAAGDMIEIRSLDGAFATAAGTTIQGGAGADTFIYNLATPANTNIDLLGGANNDVFTINQLLDGEVNGGTGIDTLQGTVISVVVLQGADVDGFDGSEADINGGLNSFDGIEVINADIASATSLTGLDDANTWLLNGGTTGTYDDSDNTTPTPQLTFNDFDTLIGGSGNDSFRVVAASTFNLDGQTGDDSFDIDAVLTGTISGGTGVDLLTGDLIVAITLLAAADANGYSGNEPTAIVGGAPDFTGINSIIASPVTDSTLNGADVNAIWTLDGSPRYDDGVGGGTDVLNFFGFETLNGGSGDDIFRLIADPNDGLGTAGTTLNGNAGDDLFDIDVAFLGQVNGGGVGIGVDLDTLSGNAIDAVVLVSSDDLGFNGTENSITPVAGNGFIGIDRIVASTTVNSSLTGRNFTSTWEIDGVDSTYTDGSYSDASPRLLPIDVGFDSLIGGTSGDVFNITGDSEVDLFGGDGADTFNVAAAATLTGTIAGQGGDDLLQGTGIVDVTLLASTGATEFSGLEDNITGGFTGIGNIIGSGTLTGEGAAAAPVSTWTLDGNPTYNDGVNTLDFSGFAALQGQDGVDNFTVSNAAAPFSLLGGDGADNFVLNAPLAAGNSINGQLGSDTLSGTTIASVTLTGASGIGQGVSGMVGSVPGGFAGIDNLIGAGGGTFTGAATDSTWALDGGAAEQYTTGGESVSIANFPTLQGGAGVDTFNVTADVTQTLRGGDSDDIFNLSAVLTGDIIAEGGADDIVNFLEVVPGVTFGRVVGNIDLGNTGTLSFIAQSQVAMVTIIAPGTMDGFQLVNVGTTFITGNANNITRVIGSSNPNVNDTLTGLNAFSTWNVSGGAGFGTYVSVARSMTFFNFKVLQGGASQDNFNVIGPTSGTVLNGGDGNDVFTVNAPLTAPTGTLPINGQGGIDLLRGTQINSVVLTNSDGNGFDGTEDSLINDIGQSFNDIELINGNGTATSSLTGENNAATWELDNAPRYTDDGVNFLSIGLNSFRNLRGGSAVDTFDVLEDTTANLFGDAGAGAADTVFLRDNATLTGTISLGDGLDTVQFIGNGDVTGLVDGGAVGAILDYSAATGPITVQVNQNGALTGFAGAATSTGGFDNITDVIGSSASDTLTSNLAAPNTPTFAITGLDIGLLDNGPTSILNFTSIENLNGGADVDTFEFVGGSLSGNVTGGGGLDTLDYQLLAGPVTVNFASAASGVVSNVSGTVSGIENAIGTTAGDTFTGDSASSNTFTGLAGDDTYNFVVLTDTDAADIVVDSAGSDTINFSQATIPINLDLDFVGAAQPGSTAGTYDVTLIGAIENYVGSDTQNDTLAVNANALPGEIRTLQGGGQTTADTLTIDATGLMVTMLSAGSFTFSNGAVINFTGWEAVNLVGVASIALDAAALAGLTFPLDLTGVTDIMLTGLLGADDNVVFTATSVNSGILNVNGSPNITFSDLNSFTFNGQGGDGAGMFDDVLTINNPAVGLFAPAGGIVFNAGGGGTLQVLGGAATAVTYNFTNNNDGSIALINGATVANYVYTGLAPIIDTVTATTRTFTFNGGDETIDLTDDAVAGQMMIDSTLGESVTFTNPTGTLTINSLNGTDIINLTSVDAAFNASVTVTTDQSAGDTINLGTSLNLGSATATGDLSLTADTINLGTTTAITINTDGAGTTNAGSVTLSGGAIINIDQDVTIDTNHATGTDGTFNTGTAFDGVTGGARSLTFDVGTTDLVVVGDFSTLAFTTADNVLANDANAINLGTSVVGNSGGALNIFANGGITQSGTITQAAGAGAVFFGAGAAPITLNLAGNDFTNSVTLFNTGANNVAITDTNALHLSTFTVGSGTLTVTAGAGGGASGITQVAGTTITQEAAAGAATFTGNAGVITLTEIGNEFIGTVNANNTGANAIQITDASAIDLGTVTTANNLRIEARGSGATGTITDSGVISVGGNTVLIAGGDIILDSVNTFTGTVQVSLTAAAVTDRDLTLVDTTALQLDNLTPATDLFVNNLNVTALGITQADTLIVQGTANLNGGAAAITLADANNDFIGQVNANNTGANAITLVDVNDVNLGTVTTANNLSVTAGAPGSITDSGVITVGGLTTLTANGGSIVLNNANTFTGLVQVSLATTGDLTLNDTTALNLENQTVGVQTVTVNNLNITALGITQTDNFTVNGTTTLNGLTGAVNLGNAANDFVGPVSAMTTGAGGVTLADANAIVLANINTTGDLTVTAVGITQLAGSTITVTGLTTLNGGAGVVTLTNATNDFLGAVSANNTGANAISLTDVNNILLGTVNSPAGSLTVNATNDITQNGGGVTVGGTSSFTSTAGNVLLNVSPNNNFTGDVSASAVAGNVALSDLNAISLGTVTAGVNLSVIANGVGTITDNGVINVTGNTQLTAGGNITLDSVNTFTGTVQVELVNSSSLTLVDTTALALDRLNPGTLQVTNLNITAVGITQVDTLIATGTTNLNGGAGVITLNDAANNFIGAVTLTNTGNNDISVTDLNALLLGNVSMSAAGTGALTLNAVGITQNAGTTITTGTGAVMVNGGAGVITLANAGNDFNGDLSLTNTGANNISVNDVDNLQLGNVAMQATAAGTLTLTSVGLTQTGTIISGTGNVTINAGAGAIVLGNANDFNGATALTNTGNNNITVNDVDDLVLGTVSMTAAGTGTLNLTSVGLTQSGATTITTGTGAVTIDGGAGVITLTNNNDFNGVTSLTNTGNNNIAVNDVDDLQLGNVMMMAAGTGTLTLTSVGLSQTGTIVSGTGNITVNGGAGAIALGNANDFNGTLALTNTGNNNITVNDVDDLVLGTVSMTAAGTGTLSLTAVGISQSGVTTITTGTGAVSVDGGAGAIALGNNNDFNGVLTLTNTGANNITVNDVDNLVLGNVAMTAAAAGALSLSAVGITQNAGTTIVTGTGAVTVNGGAAAITLANAGNDFNGVVSLNNTGAANNVSVVDVDNIDIGNSAVGGNLTVNAAGLVDFVGAGVTTVGGTLNITTTAAGISDSGAGSISITGTSTLNAGANAITLDNVANNFIGAVTITAATNASLDDANAITFNNVSISGTLDVDSSGAVTFNGTTNVAVLDVDTNANGVISGDITDGVGGVLTVTGTTTLDADASNVALDTITNDFQGTVTVTAANNVSLVDQNSLTIGGINAAGTVTATARGDNSTLTLNAAAAVNAGGAVTFNADDMNFIATSSINAAGQTVTLLPFNAGDAINLGAVGEAVLDTLELSAAEVALITAANLVVGNVASGPITISAGITTTGATNVTITTALNNNITFSGAAAQLNASGGNVTLTTNAAGVGGVASTGAGATDVLANLLTVTAGEGDIGAAGNPLTFNATTLVTNTGVNGQQFLSEVDTVTWNTSTATATNSISLEGGTFNVGTGQTITASVVNVGAGVTLGGNGTIIGNVTSTGTGNVAPGTSPGILTINGNYNPGAMGVTTIELNGPYAVAGTDFDRLVVNGTINLNGSTLTLAGGAVAPAAGLVIPIILNDGVDAITGTFGGFADGAMVTINNFMGFISYFGGDGNDVTLTVGNPGATTIVGTAGADVFEVRRIGNTIQTLLGGVVVDARPLAALAGGLTIDGAAGNDTLTVNYGAAGGAFAVPVSYIGGTQTGGTGDDLIVTGGTFTSLEYDVTGVGAGTLNFVGATNGTVIFTEIEPATVTSAVGTVTIDIDNGPGPDAFAGPITTTVTGAGGNTTVAFSGGAESLTFANPSVGLVINGDMDGDDTITVTSVDAAFRAALTINGNGGTDTINLATSLLLGSTTSTGDLAFTAETINLGSGAGAINIATDQTAAPQLAAGSVTLTGTTINIDRNVTIDTNHATLMDGVLTVNGTIDAVTAPPGVVSTLTLDLGTTDVMLNDAANNFSTVLVTSANNVTLVDSTGIDLGASTIAGTLNITANGLISDSGAVSVAGTTTLAAGAANNITLDTVTNDFNTVIITNALNVTLRDADNIDLGGPSTISGTLAVTTTNGAITDSGNVAVTGNASFNSGTANITLGDAGENTTFGTLTFTSTGAVSISEDDATVLTGTNTANSLVLTSEAGSITDAAGTSLTVTNNALFTTLGAALAITLGDSPTDTTNFGSLSFVSTGAVSISENSATVLTGAANAALSLNLTSETGSITDAIGTTLAVTNNATLTTTAVGQAITLGDDVTDNTTFGTLTFVSTGAVAISENDATILTDNNSASSLVLTSEAGTITDSAGTALNVTNNAAFTTAAAAQAITLGDDPTDTTNFGSLTFTSTGAVSISENSATVLTGINTANALTLTSETGSITDNAGTSLTVTNNATFTTTAAAQAITLGDNAADTTNFGTLTFVSTGAVSISENSDMVLTGANSALSLALISETGTITDAAVTALAVTNNATFTSNAVVGSGITLGDNAGDTTDFGTLTFSSTGAVLISENSDTVLTGTSTALSLVLTSETGTVTDAVTTSLTVTNNARFVGTAITLGDNAGDTTNFGTLSFTSAGAVTITEDSTMNVAGTISNTSAALTLTSQTGDVRVQDTGAPNDINANGAVTINVPTNERFFISDTDGEITSAGAVTIAADKMSLAGAINAAGQTVTLRPFSTTDAINLGSTGDLNSIGNTLELSDAELDLITGNLVIGNAAAATGQTITVLGAVTLGVAVPNVTLVTGGNSRITFFNTGSLTATGNVTLTTSAAGTGGIDSGNAAVDVTAGAASLLTISTGSGGIGTLANPLTFATGNITTNTSSSNAGQFLLSAQAGAIGVVSFNAATGTITLLDGDYTLTANEVINNQTDITLTSPATLAMAGFTETFDALNGTGNVSGAGSLTLGANNHPSATHSGVISGTLSLTKIGTGTQTLSGNNSYSGQTLVNGTTGTLILSGTNTGNGITDVLAGTLLVNGSTMSATTVSLAGVLGGTGTINADVLLQAGSTATFAPGSPVNTTADLVIVGNLTMNAGTIYSVNVNGSTPNTQHDQAAVTGNVILGGATLVTAGTVTSSPGQQIVLIANDGLDAVTGTFAGLAEGATVTIGSVNFFISYQGGAGGNDVTLTQLGPATYTSDGVGAGALELRMVTTVIGSSVQFVDDDAIVDARPLAALLNQLITVNGTNAQSETLTVNYTTVPPANGFFDVDILFHGGVGGADNDALNVIGGTFTTATHTFTNAGPEHSGNIVYNTGAAIATISYTGLEPINMTGSTFTNLVFNLPAGGNTATLSDGGGAGESLLSSGGTFENTVFSNPTGSLTINGGTGADSIVIDSVDAAFVASLAINGAGGSDTLSGLLIDAVTLTSSDGTGFDGTEVNTFTTTFADFETIIGNGGTLTGQGTATSTWGLDGTPTYTTGGNALNFSGFATLIGGSGSDTFNISANSTFNLVGGDGADTFAFTNPVVLTGTIDGGLGNDTLIGDNDGNAFDVTGANTGTLPNTTGGWSSVENLTGGSGDDIFTVNAAGSLTGAISGLLGNDTLDLSAIVGASATITALNAAGATLNPVTSIGGGASGINVLTGEGTGTLTGENANRTWNLDATQTYTDGVNTLTFSNFNTLQGGSGADMFNVIADTTIVLNGGGGADVFDIDATLTGSVHGQGGTDTLQGDVIIDVTLAGSTAAEGFFGDADTGIDAAGDDFTGIDNVIGSGTLTGRDVVSLWTLDAVATYFDGTATLAFSGFMALQGGTDSDTFNITAESTFNLSGGEGTDLFDVDAPLTGTIAGQAGDDTLQGSLIDDVTLTGSVADDGFTGNEPDINAGTDSFAGIDTIIGNGGSLTGRDDVASTWDLDGTPTYQDGTATLGFSGFDNLLGGAAADTFNVTSASTFNLFGGGGDDVFDIDAVLTGSIAGGDEDTPDGDVLQGNLVNDVTLFGAAGDGYSGADLDITGSFSGINTIIGDGGRLIGVGVNSTWLVNDTPTYNDGSGNLLNFSGFATLQGGAANDTFTVTAASPFTLLGGAGNDRFTFNGGRLTNGGFADGEAGNDTLNGTGAIVGTAMVGNPMPGLTLNGGAGIDSIIGSSFNDLLSGGDGNDSINAAAGNDTLSGGTGNNTLNGGLGTDWVTELVTAKATLTNTKLTGIGNSTLVSIEAAELFGNSANNLIDASAFIPVNITPPLPGLILRGGDGNDTLIGTSKNDALFGGDGLDTVRLRSTTGATIVATNGTLTNGTTTDVLDSIEALDLTGHATKGTIINAAAFSGFTTLTGGSGRDILTAGQKTSVLRGNAGNDVLTGGAGDDLFYGGAGNDSMLGGAGNDIMRGEAGNDTLDGGIGDDRLFGDAGRDRISGGAGQDSLDGGADNDTLLGGDGHDSIGGGIGNDLITGGSGDDRLFGDAGNDTLLGDDGNDVLSGAGGRDVLLGGAGSDRLDGGGDKDTLAGQGGSDTLIGSSDEINNFFVFDIHRLLI